MASIEQMEGLEQQRRNLETYLRLLGRRIRFRGGPAYATEDVAVQQLCEADLRIAEQEIALAQEDVS